MCVQRGVSNLPSIAPRRTLGTGNRLDGRCIASRYGGKSGLHRTGRQVTPGRRKPTESATENIPPKFARTGKGEKVR